MEKMIVVVFDNESKALDGWQALRELDNEGHISVYEAQILEKQPSGALRVIDNVDMMGFTLVAGGTGLGALLGLLGGPVGVLVGGAAGALIGAITDLEKSGVTSEFVNDVEKVLTPGKIALAADIVEEWVTPVDTAMERIGGVVFRRTRTFVKDTQDGRDAAAHRAEMEQLKVERTRARADRLAKIDAKIDNLRAKLESATERKRAAMQLHQQQREAKIRALQTKADQAEGETRRHQEARIAELRREYVEKASGV